MKNNWLKSNKSIDVFACDTTECTAVVDLKAENERLKAENKELKQKLNWLTIAHKSEQEERTKLELALAKIKVRIINENADDCLLDIKEIIDEVL